MTTTDHPWLLRDHAPRALPAGVPEGVEYHRVLAGERPRVLRGLLAIVLLLAGLVGFSLVFVEAAELLDTRVLDRDPATSPLTLLAGSLSLALLIPWSMLVQRLLYGAPASSLHSVTGRFRFEVLGRTLLLLGPLVLVAVGVTAALLGGERVAWSSSDLVVMFLGGLLVSPLAAAGEEYGFRGLMFRVVGGWSRSPRAGLVAGVVVTTVGFSLVHGTLDPYLLTSYLLLFGSLAVVTWRTGGLETAVVLHAVYNLAILLAVTLHLDLLGELDSRGTAAGSPLNLLPAAAVVLATAIVWWRTRRTGPLRTPTADQRAVAAGGW